MRMCSIASGSSGNCIYVGSGSHHLLIDAGISGKRVEAGLKELQLSGKDIDGILLTHEHSDHIKGLGVLSRKYEIPIYATPGTAEAVKAMSSLGKIDGELFREIHADQDFQIGDLLISPFHISHDAAEPQFYQVHHNNKTFCIITDTGYVSDRVEGTIRNADAYLMECNHDTEMLRMGPYSWPLKQRILSDTGHLSNEEGADALMDVLGSRTKRIFLGHRSQHNNMRSLAHLTVATIMERHDFGVNHDFQLVDAEPDKPSKLLTV